MPFVQLPLPFAEDALAPYMSEETIRIHYGKHHASYVSKLNELTNNTPLANTSIIDIIKTQTGKVFNMASQAWNHEFFWNCLRPSGGGNPPPRLSQAIDNNFGSFDNFKSRFAEEAAGHFASGWVWLVSEPNNPNKLSVVSTHDAGNPMTCGQRPLLILDVWEHSYYVDYKNDRLTYIKNWWNIVNWEYVQSNMDTH